MRLFGRRTGRPVGDPVAVIKLYAIAGLKLVRIRNTCNRSYWRYFDSVGLVVGFSGDLVKIQVFGNRRVSLDDWWALRLKRSSDRPTYRKVTL